MPECRRPRRGARVEMAFDTVETGSFCPADTMRPAPKAIQVVSWNLARGSRLGEIVAFLRSINADLICLQETDRGARRTHKLNIAAEIAGALRMNYVFGIEFQELAEGSSQAPAYHGQATLSPFPLIDGRILRFRNQSRFWQPCLGIPRLSFLQRRLGGRMALVTRIRICEKDLLVYNVHLESRSDDVRRAQLSQLLEETEQHGGDTLAIVAGDFNLDISQPSASSLITRANFHNPLSYNGMRPTPGKHFGRRGPLDWIVTRALPASSARVHTSVVASDHFPVSVVLKMA